MDQSTITGIFTLFGAAVPLTAMLISQHLQSKDKIRQIVYTEKFEIYKQLTQIINKLHQRFILEIYKPKYPINFTSFVEEIKAGLIFIGEHSLIIPEEIFESTTRHLNTCFKYIYDFDKMLQEGLSDNEEDNYPLYSFQENLPLFINSSYNSTINTLRRDLGIEKISKDILKTLYPLGLNTKDHSFEAFKKKPLNKLKSLFNRLKPKLIQIIE